MRCCCTALRPEPDRAADVEPAELAQLVIETKRAWQSVGRVQYGPSRAEATSVKHRRSIYIAEDIEAGAAPTQGAVSGTGSAVSSLNGT